MMIGQSINQAFNEQIGHEFGASMQYIAIASYFEYQNLRLLANLFFKQSDEEKEHAMKFVKYIIETQGSLQIPAIAAPKPTFTSAEEAVSAALNWEKEVTGQINNLMRIAIEEKDYLAQSFLKWFVDEQLEEVSSMDRLLSVIQRAGEKNLLMVEAYLIHEDKAG